MSKYINISFLIALVFLSTFKNVFSQQKIVLSTVAEATDWHVGAAVLAEAYNRIGYEIELIHYEGTEALIASNSGIVDGELQRIDGISRTFPNLLQVQIPINYIQGYAFTKNLQFEIDGWFSLKPYKIGIVKGIIFAELGTQGMNVVKADNYNDLINLLLNDEIDLAVMPLINGKVLLKKMSVENIKPLPGVLETMFLYHYLHLKNEHIVKALEKELKSMLLDGTTRIIKTENNKNIIKDIK